MHLCLWVSDEDWKKLPVPLKESINMAMNEIKVLEALKQFGGEDERTVASSQMDEVKKFIAIFKQKYVEFTDMAFSGTIDSASKFILRNTLNRLSSEGSTSQEYLNWFFDDFMSDEFNKKRYAPPQLKTVLRNDILDKYIYLNKDRLKVRKQDVMNYKVKNALMTLATEYLKRNLQAEFSKEFGQNVLNYSRGTISLKKFSTLFLNLLHTQGEQELYEEVKSIIGDAA